MAEELERIELGGPVGLGRGDGRREYRCRFVRAGLVRAAGNRPGNLSIEPEALKGALARGMFDGRAVFVDHAGWFEYPSVERLVGVTARAEWNESDQSIEGTICLYSTPLGKAVETLLDQFLTDGMGGPDLGLSIVFWPVFAPRDNEEDPRRVVDVRHVESVDLVFEPAADGRVLAALSAGLQAERETTVKTLPGADPAERIKITFGGKHMEDENLVQDETLDQGSGNGVTGQATTGQAAQAEAWLNAMQAQGARAMITNSGLPAASQERLLQASYSTPAEVQAAIEAERAYLARLAEANVVQIGGQAPRGGQVSGMRTGLDRLRLAYEALISGVRPPDGVAPLSGIREAYMLLSGDYELSGMFHPERVTLQNVDSATMAGLTADALNKRVVNLFQEYPRWWEKVVTIEDFTTLQDVKWITLGGVGELPTVNEGAGYTELNWADSQEQWPFVKKGGFLGITLEAIDKDDTRKLQAAPRALAQAAWLTLSKAVAGIFTAGGGVGPQMADGQPLFAPVHNNVNTLALSYENYVTVRAAMRKQAELGSAEPLGALTAPKYLLVPPDLEIAALQILGSEIGITPLVPGGGNPLTEGDTLNARMAYARERVVVVDLWQDADDWAAVADPKLYPSIGLGFRYGRTPEIFSVASPSQGLMFTNDTMPVKVRFMFAVGPVDWRGMYKNNVNPGP